MLGFGKPLNSGHNKLFDRRLTNKLYNRIERRLDNRLADTLHYQMYGQLYTKLIVGLDVRFEQGLDVQLWLRLRDWSDEQLYR